MSSTAKDTDATATVAPARGEYSGARLFALLTLLLLPFLLWRAGASVAWLLRAGESWGPATAELFAETDDALYRRALGAEYPAFAALRHHVPPGARIVLVGGSPESAMFYQHMECMLYPSRLTPVLAENLAGLAPNLRAMRAAPGTEGAPPVYVFAYAPPPELELASWFAGVPGLVRVPAQSGHAEHLYRLDPAP